MASNITSKNEDSIEGLTEIGCMCERCNCNKKTLLVTSICDSCLKGKHNGKNSPEYYLR